MDSEIRPMRVYSLETASRILEVSESEVQSWIAQGVLVGRCAGHDYRILGQALIDFLLHTRPKMTADTGSGEPQGQEHAAIAPEEGRVPGNVYSLRRTRGGKDDADIAQEVTDHKETLLRREPVTLRPASLRRPHWNGQTEVAIDREYATFAGRGSHTLVPVAIKAAVRCLHAAQLYGSYTIGVWDDVLTIRPMASDLGPESITAAAS